MTRPTITVHADLSRNAWVATFHHDQDMKETIGTDTILTAFTLAVDGETARREVERLNPHARVRLVRRDGTLYDPETAADHGQGRQNQQGGGGFEVPDSWLAVVEEMRREGAPTVEKREAREAEAARLRLN